MLQTEDAIPGEDAIAGTRAAVPAGAALVIVQGFFEGLEVPIDRDRVVVGRGKGSDLVLPEPTISRAHAAVGYDADTQSFFVEDLESTNGTYVNGAQIGHCRLKSDDQLQMGKLLIRFTLARGFMNNPG